MCDIWANIARISSILQDYILVLITVQQLKCFSNLSKKKNNNYIKNYSLVLEKDSITEQKQLLCNCCISHPISFIGDAKSKQYNRVEYQE